MDTTPPPPPPSPPAPARAGHRLFRLRTLGADLVDVTLVVAAGTAVGVVLFSWFETDDPVGFENLAAFLLAGMVGAGVALVVAIIALVMTARGGSPGDRLVSRRHDGGAGEVGWRVARWLALPFAVSAASGAAAVLAEPGVASLLVPPVAGGLALGILVVAYVDQAHDDWLRAVGVAAAVGATLGLVGTVAVPTRAPYGFELRAAAEDAALDALPGLGARRVCSAPGVADVPTASHQTQPCADPDAVWAVPGSAATVADDLARTVESTTQVSVEVVVHDASTPTTQDAFELRLPSSSTLAWVTGTSCGTRVLVGAPGVDPRLDADVVTPDRQLTARCA